ncbi:MAG: hypothetical protein ACEQSF_01640 [Solirubrobacteraceae bacterium]
MRIITLFFMIFLLSCSKEDINSDTKPPESSNFEDLLTIATSKTWKYKETRKDNISVVTSPVVDYNLIVSTLQNGYYLMSTSPLSANNSNPIGDLTQIKKMTKIIIGSKKLHLI